MCEQSRSGVVSREADIILLDILVYRMVLTYY